MNIKQAKDYIKDCVKIYLKKDEFGEYRIPVVRQRPESEKLLLWSRLLRNLALHSCPIL